LLVMRRPFFHTRLKKSSIIGLDIGSYSLKVVQLERKGQRYRLLNFGILPLTPEAIIEGTVIDREQVIEAIKNLMEIERIKTKEVVISLSGPGVIVKKIRLPYKSEEDLTSNIYWSIDKYIPFNPEEVNLDFQVIDSTLGGEADLVLVAAKKELIEEYTNLIWEAGLKPAVVDIDLFAAENSYELNYGLSNNQTTAFIDIGSSITNISVIQGEQILFAEDISGGGNDLTRAIEREYEVDFYEAEALKMGVSVQGISCNHLIPFMLSVIENIIEKIRELLYPFYSLGIAKIILSGGGAKLQGLDRILSQELFLPVEIANPFKNIEYDSKQFDPEYINYSAPLAAVAVGLAARHIPKQ